MVMISMIKSTSITSISGVVLMSIISSGSPDPPPLPTFIPMKFSLSRGAGAAHGRFGNEPDLEYAGALACEHHPADEFVACALVGPNMHFGLGLLHRNLLESGQQFLIVDKFVVPKDIAVLVDGNVDVLGLGLRGLVCFFRQFHRSTLDDYGNRDQEDDQQHQHHIHQGRGIDRRDDFVLGLQRTNAYPHRQAPLRRSRPRLPPNKVMCTPPPKCRISSIATLLRLTSQL